MSNNILSRFAKETRNKITHAYNIWKKGFDYQYQIPEEGITDTMGSHIYSFHHIGGGESARDRQKGGWQVDWTLDEDHEADPNYGIVTMDVRRYTKWQYMTLREKKSIDPSVWRAWYHPTRPPVITNGLSPHQFKPSWMQQQLVLFNRWQLQGVPPKPGNPYHMHDAPHKDHAADWYWPYATYDEFMVALNKARYMESKSGQRDQKKDMDLKWREEEMNAPQV